MSSSTKPPCHAGSWRQKEKKRSKITRQPNRFPAFIVESSSSLDLEYLTTPIALGAMKGEGCCAEFGWGEVLSGDRQGSIVKVAPQALIPLGLVSATDSQSTQV